MTRQRAHWIECDECREQSDGSLGLPTARDAVDTARQEGWLLGARRNGRRVDLCAGCRIPDARRAPMISDAEHRRRAGSPEGEACDWCGGIMGADEDTCQHEDCGRGAKIGSPEGETD